MPSPYTDVPILSLLSRTHQTADLSGINLSSPSIYVLGICEPMDSDECQHKNDWEVDCSVPEFICDELNKTEGELL